MTRPERGGRAQRERERERGACYVCASHLALRNAASSQRSDLAEAQREGGVRRRGARCFKGQRACGDSGGQRGPEPPRSRPLRAGPALRPGGGLPRAGRAPSCPRGGRGPPAPREARPRGASTWPVRGQGMTCRTVASCGGSSSSFALTSAGLPKAPAVWASTFMFIVLNFSR